MSKIIVTCLLVVGVAAAVAKLPNAIAHEGHSGHNHDAPPQQNEQEDSASVVTAPPPFETLESEPSRQSQILGNPPQQPKPYRETEAPTARDPGFNASPSNSDFEKRRDEFPNAPQTFERQGRDSRRCESPEGCALGRSALTQRTSPQFVRPYDNRSSDYNCEFDFDSSWLLPDSSSRRHEYGRFWRGPLVEENSSCNSHRSSYPPFYADSCPRDTFYSEAGSCQYGEY